MAVALKSYNYITRYSEFFIDNESDLEKLPTASNTGADDLCIIGPVAIGSTAFFTNTNDVCYRLTEEEVWVKIIINNGNHSGVSGVKGASESMYRKGDVELSLEDLAKLGEGLSYDALTHTLDISPQASPQSEELEKPGAENAGRIRQYTGETTEDLIKGRFYECVYDEESGQYEWEEIPVQNEEGLTNEQIDALLALI